jgi:hypothetical protein
VSSVIRSPHYHAVWQETETLNVITEPVQNEGIDGSYSRVLELDIGDLIEVSKGDTIRLVQHERISDVSTTQFGGTISEINATSYPNKAILTCLSQMERLLKVPTADHDLSGRTDGSAVRWILEQCNIDFDATDIKSAGYVLGAIRPVYWLKDQPAFEIIQQIDEVFGYRTIDIENNRPVRFKVKWDAHNADVEYTYTRGVDCEYWGNQRTQGGKSAIVNVVNVTGLNWTNEEDDGGDGCSRTVWARAYGVNAALGDDEYNRGMPFSSDIIQSEDLAKTVARRLIRQFNREPDTITLVALNDLNVRPGTVIGVSDDAYGIDLDLTAANYPFLVTNVDRRGDEMTLQCTHTEPVGTYDVLESGVQRVCNKNGTTTTTDPTPWEDDGTGTD